VIDVTTSIDVDQLAKVVHGYSIKLVNYLAEAAVGPRERFGSCELRDNGGVFNSC
jgi:hypothetical protein